MMKRLCLIIFAYSILFGVTMTAHAQNESAERRRCLSKAFITLYEYEEECNFNQDGITRLFVNHEAQVYNDLMGLSDAEMLRIEDYARILGTKVSTHQVILKNVKTESVIKSGDVWRVVCNFEKEMSYIDNDGIVLSSRCYYKKDYQMYATLVYNPETDVCRIERIEGHIDASRLPTAYSAIEMTDSLYDVNLRYRKTPIAYVKECDNQALFPERVTRKRLSYADSEVLTKLVPKETGSHLMNVKYNPVHWHLRPHYDLGLGDFYDISSIGQITSKSKGNEFGIDIGYTVPSKGHVKFSINFGVAYSTSTIDLSMPEQSFSYNASSGADVDGDTYVRHYNIGATTESLKMSFINIPFYFDLDFCFSRYFSMYLQAGVKPYMKLNATLDSYSTSADIYGIYPQYDNLRMDGNWGRNGFGHRDFTASDVSQNTPPVKSFSLDGFGGAGFRIKPVKSVPLALEVGVYYQMGIISMWDKDNYILNTSGRITANQSLLSYTVVGGEKARMLNTGLTDVKRQRLMLNIGIIYKF